MRPFIFPRPHFMPFTPPAGLLRKLLTLLLISNVLLLLFFIVFDYQLIFHSDAAAKNLLAQEIVETGQYFPRDWNYINGDLWVFFNHSFIVPLLAFMPNGFAAHAASDIVSAALLLWGSWHVTGMLGQSRTARLASMILLTSGMSEIMAEHMYGQAAYGAAYYLACFLMYSYWSLTRARGRARWGWALATAALAALVFWANPQRAGVFYGAPLLLAAGTLLALELRGGAAAVSCGGVPGAYAIPTRRSALKGHALCIALLLAGFAAGALLHGYTLHHVINHRGLTVMNWLPYDAMVRNAQAIVGGLLGILGGVPRPATEVASLEGAYQLLRVAGALALMVLAPLALRRALHSEHRGRIFVAVFALAMLGLNLLIMLTTTLADMASPEGSVRYLVPGVLLLLMITSGELLDRPVGRPATRAAGLLTLAIIGTSAAPSFLSPYYQHFLLPPAARLPSANNDLLAFLRDNGLQYGYASFWNAGKLTVMSNHGIRVRQVVIENGLPMPMRKLSSNRWYQLAAWNGPTFLMLTPNELAQLDKARLAAEMGQPERTLRHGDLTVLVYPRNLAALASWDANVSQPLHFSASERSPHHIGSYDAAAGAMVADAGMQGALHFGPYIELGKGRYQVRFDVETGAAPAGAELGTVDAASAAGTVVHARQAVTASGRQQLTLTLELRQPVKLLEFRVFTNGVSKVLLRDISVVRSAAPAPG